MRTEIIIFPLPARPNALATQSSIHNSFYTVTKLSPPGARLSIESADNIPGPKTSYVCRVCINDQSFNNFENDTMKVSVNEAKWTAWELGLPVCELGTVLQFNWFTLQNLPSDPKSYHAFRETGLGVRFSKLPKTFWSRKTQYF